MAKLSVVIGILLCAVGISGYLGSESKSVTALIPLFVGAPIAISAALTLWKPAKAVIFMHIAVTFALLGFLAAAGRIPMMLMQDKTPPIEMWTMCVLCFMLVGAYVQSFLKARSNKEG